MRLNFLLIEREGKREGALKCAIMHFHQMEIYLLSAGNMIAPPTDDQDISLCRDLDRLLIETGDFHFNQRFLAFFINIGRRVPYTPTERKQRTLGRKEIVQNL